MFSRKDTEVLPCMVLLSNKEAVAPENSSSSGMDTGDRTQVKDAL